jgi:hypothetical protein
MTPFWRRGPVSGVEVSDLSITSLEARAPAYAWIAANTGGLQRA